MCADSARASSGIFKGFIVVNPNGSGNTFYQTQGGGANPAFGGNNFGSFDAATGTLILNGYEVNTFQNNNDDIQSAFGDFRVYKVGATPPSFTENTVLFNSNGTNAGDKKWQTTGQNTQLLSLMTYDAGATYTFDAYLRAHGVNNGNGFDIFDGTSGSPYAASFSIAISNFTYNGSSASSNTGVAGNWSTGRAPGNGHNLFFGSTNAVALTNTLTSANSLTFNSGAGAFTIGSGTLSLAAGITDNSTAATETITTPLTLSASQSFDVANNANLVVGGALTGGSGIVLTKTSAGTLTLSGASTTFSGAVTLSAGTLNIGDNSALGTGTFNINGGTIQANNATARALTLTQINIGGDFTIGGTNTGALSFTAPVNLGAATRQITDNNTTNPTTFTGVISGSAGAGLTKLGNGQLNLAGATANTYSGVTTVSAGTLGLGKTTSVNAFGGDLTINGGSVIYSSSSDNQIVDSAKVTVSSGSLAFGARNETIGTTSTGTSGLVLSGTGAVTMSSGTVNFSNSASITGGTMTLTSSATVNFNSDLAFSGGTLDSTYTGATGSGFRLRGGTGTGVTYSSSGTSTAVISNSGGGSATLNLNTGANANTIFNIGDGTQAVDMNISMPITGGASTNTLQKTGNGTLQFSGGLANTYTGLTTVSAGVLQLNKSGGTQGTSLATAGNITVDNGGTLTWLQSEQVSDTATVTVNASGTANLGAGLTENLGTLNTAGITNINGTLIGHTASFSATGGTTTVGSTGSITDGHIAESGSSTAFEVQGGGIVHLLSGGAGLQLTGATMTLDSSGGTAGKLLLDGDVATFTSSTTSNITSGGNLGSAGFIDMNGGTRSFTVASGTTASGIDLRIGATVTSPGGAITKLGTGTMELTGANTYTGGTNVNGGTLLANNTAGSATGAGGVMVNSSGTLGGTGFINAGTNNINIGKDTVGMSTGNGGTITGATVGPNGAPTAANVGALTLAASNVIFGGVSGDLGTYVVDFVGATSDRLNITGVLDLSSAFDRIVFNGTPDGTTTYVLATYTSETGTFDSMPVLPAGYSLVYGATELDLVAVPETSTWVMGALALTTLLATQRRRLSFAVLQKVLGK